MLFFIFFLIRDLNSEVQGQLIWNNPFILCFSSPLINQSTFTAPVTFTQLHTRSDADGRAGMQDANLLIRRDTALPNRSAQQLFFA